MMSIWATFLFLLAIAGFYIFLSIYMVFHLISRFFLPSGRR